MRGSVVKKGSNYYCVFRDPVTKKQRWRKAGSSKRRAEKMLTEVVGDIHQGTYQDIEELTFSEFGKKWLEDYADPSVGNVRETTYRRYSEIIRLHLDPSLGPFNLTQINPHQIEKYLGEKARNTNLKPATIQKQLRLLKNMLRRAVKWGYLARDPSQYIDGPKVPREERRIPEKKEIQKLLEDVKANDPEFYPLLFTAILTGMRRGELLGLTWEDVDFKRNRLNIRHSLVLGKLQEPKSNAGIRVIDFGENLRSVLRKHKLSSTPSDLVFPSKTGSPMIATNMIRRRFLPALKRVGLDGLRFHDLRHVHNTYLYQDLPRLGISPQFIAKRMGHASTKLGFDNYGHAMEAKSDIGDRIEDAILGKTTSQKASGDF